MLLRARVGRVWLVWAAAVMPLCLVMACVRICMRVAYSACCALEMCSGACRLVLAVRTPNGSVR